jgi:O-methyltransferase
MDNTFLRDAFYWARQDPRRFRFANRVLRKLQAPFRLAPALDPRRDMTNLEMRINFFHLVQQACVSNAEGDVAEFGSYTGETAALFGEVLRDLAPHKTLHIFDSFEEQYELPEPIRPLLEANLRSRGVPRWEVHQGRFDKTVPSELPEKLCFVNIDCGSGGGPSAIAAHKAIVLYILENVYPRLSAGAVLALTDYCDRSRNDSFDANPGVKQAADEFFAGKPERVDVLLSGELSLGCVRKQ